MELLFIPFSESTKYAAAIPMAGYSREYHNFVKKRYGMSSGFLELRDNGKLLSIVPVCHNDSTLYAFYKEYTEPKTFDASPIAWNEVADLARKKLKLKSAEFYFAGIHEAEYRGMKSTGFSTYVFRMKGITDGDAIRSRFHNRTRLHKAERFGFDFRIIGEESLHAIYDLYLENMHRHGTPPRSLGFFQDLFACFGKACYGISLYDKDVLAGLNLMVSTNGYARMHFNISKKEYWEHCVNNLLYVKTIEHALASGVSLVDFGGAPDTDTSHNRFKMGFGLERVPLQKVFAGSYIHRIPAWMKNKKRNLTIRITKLKRLFRPVKP